MTKFNRALQQIEELVCERKSLAQELIKKAKEYDYLRDYTDHLMKVGGYLMGDGFYSSVYGGRTGGYVVKISQDPFLLMNYKEFNDLSKDNKLFPKVLAMSEAVFDDEEHQLYIFERLDVDQYINSEICSNLLDQIRRFGMNANSYDVFNELVNIINTPELTIDDDFYKELDEFFKKYKRSADEFFEFAHILWDKKSNDGAEIDIHENNFGFDEEGGMVIFDPIS